MTPVDPALLERITASMRSDLEPVRPLPGRSVLTATLLAVWAAVTLAGAAAFGFYGVRRLDIGPVVLIFTALGGFALLTAAASANAIAPGARRPVHPALLTAAGLAVLAAVFALIFPDRSAGRFLPQGLVCFRAGLLCAAPAGLAAWLALRRGFAVDRPAAGLAIGTFAGLAGLSALELHCPNFRLPHVVVWHLAVVAAAALAGYFFGSKRNAAELMQ
jgi:hypothetical protein